METKKEFDSRNYMLDFTLFMAVPAEYYYLSAKEKYHTFYVSSSCLISSSTVTETNWVGGGNNTKHSMSDFHWECIDYNLKKIQGVFQTFMLATFLLTIFSVCMKKRNNLIEDVQC